MGVANVAGRERRIVQDKAGQSQSMTQATLVSGNGEIGLPSRLTISTTGSLRSRVAGGGLGAAGGRSLQCVCRIAR